MEETTYRWPPQDDGQTPKQNKPLPNFKKLFTTIIIAAVATIMFQLLGQELLMFAASGSVCLMLVLYWVSYFILNKKY